MARVVIGVMRPPGDCVTSRRHGALDREGMWQGIRDWFRPAAAGSREARRRGRPSAPVETTLPASRERREPGVRGNVSGPPASALRSDLPSGLPSDLPSAHLAARSAGEGAAVLDAECEELELLEFLAADLDPVPVDPAFRERLREELWSMVLREGAGGRRSE